ncbi:hypothetical protein [Vagococcus fluvialis]|uniref:hypothetical protein n=1 Tax=Vagococcus fluvialis TaxID=2738 RepID=UPI00378F089E
MNEEEFTHILELLHDEIPELKNYNGDIISSKECSECGDKAVYIGPENDFMQRNTCCMCGTLND